MDFLSETENEINCTANMYSTHNTMYLYSQYVPVNEFIIYMKSLSVRSLSIRCWAKLTRLGVTELSGVNYEREGEGGGGGGGGGR